MSEDNYPIVISGGVRYVREDAVHSEEFVVVFCGFLAARVPELQSPNPRLPLDLWEEFKRLAGKRS